jgi:hypothetical protein
MILKAIPPLMKVSYHTQAECKGATAKQCSGAEACRTSDCATCGPGKAEVQKERQANVNKLTAPFIADTILSMMHGLHKEPQMHRRKDGDEKGRQKDCKESGKEGCESGKKSGGKGGKEGKDD